MAKLNSKDLAWAVYQYNRPIDYKWVRYSCREYGTEIALRQFIEGYIVAEGLNVSKNLITRAIPELEFLLR